MRRKNAKPYRIVGAYDSETTNIDDKGKRYAFPVLHQLGLIDCPIEDVNGENVEQHTNIQLFRHTLELYERLDDLTAMQNDFVPVICCHNLSFDMYPLASWLESHDVRVLAKSCRKPITFTILDENGKPSLVIWDTLVFSGQSLSRMGKDCGYFKATGKWDYNLIRTPETILSPDEIEYAKRDIYALLAWIGWWLNRNPEIEPCKLGLNVVTKTGVVRERRKTRFYNARGNGNRRTVGEYWYLHNQANLPKTDDELFTMIACTRGGFTFCASKYASVPLDLVGSNSIVLGFDATSQHPAQMVSHRYPVKFHKTSARALELNFSCIARHNTRYVLENWSKPFNSGIYACFEFTNIRPKKGSLFEKWGVYPLASARFKPVSNYELNEDNQDSQEFAAYAQNSNYSDTAINPVFAFGKLVRADVCRLFLTELTIWEISRAYEWDSMRALSGYVTGKFERPTDMAVISVMQFYKAKNAFKHAREEYFNTGTITTGNELKDLGISSNVVLSMESGVISDLEVDSEYLRLKADLNSLFGIEASNEYRRDTVLTGNGIEYEGDFGICNSPKNPKACYQFGQRIVGWSRIAQICVMELLEPYIDGIINGDTDSIKVLAKRKNENAIKTVLERFGAFLDIGKYDNCKRVKAAYPRLYDGLDGIGHYVLEFESERFCASWNKAYCTHDIDKRTGKRKFSFTLAGIPTRTVQRDDVTLLGLNYYADTLYACGWTYSSVCNLLLGYNVTIAPDLTRLNMRKFPEWGDICIENVTDYKGNSCKVVEPCALALYPMAKTINDTDKNENRANMNIAMENNPDVNITPCIIHSGGVMRFEDGY